MKLYYFPFSSCSRKVLFSLRYKGINFDHHIISLPDKQQKEAWFINLNPLGQVPVIVHDGLVLFDSSVILRYLDARFTDSPRLFPDDVSKRAYVEQLTHYADNHFYPCISKLLTQYRMPEHTRDAQEIETLKNHLFSQHLVLLDQWLQCQVDSAFILDSLTIADISFAVGLLRLIEVSEIPIPLTAAIKAWIKKIRELEAYQYIEGLSYATR